MESITKTARETQKLGEKMGLDLLREERGSPSTSLRTKSAKILALFGELGSGKTTFVQGFARSLRLPHRLVSPTFIIVREYSLKTKNFQRFYHIDLYRLENLADLESLGFSEIFADSQALVVIEWAERLGRRLPKKRMDIMFDVLNNNERKVSIHNHN